MRVGVSGWFDGLGRNAVVLTGDDLATAKTAHGLLRRSARFDLVGMLDGPLAGRSSRAVVPDGVDVPVAATYQALGRPADVAIVGVATYGGAIPAAVRRQLAEVIAAGLDVVSGLHEPVADDPDLAAAIQRAGTTVVELRAPRPFAHQRFWSGEALGLAVPRVAVLGTDCDIGKRTTLVRLVEALEARGRAVEVVATGQTGILQGARQGFVLDATPLDFISGALEEALLEAGSRHPELILIQGQGSFRGPTGQVGPQLLCHTGVSHVILQHAPARRSYNGGAGLPVADPAGDLDLIEAYGAAPLALALSGHPGDAPAETAHAEALARDRGLPVIWPGADGAEGLADLVERHVLAPPVTSG